MMHKTKTASLTQMAAALGLALGAVAAVPALADDAKTTPATQDGAAQSGSAADEAQNEGKAANPCAVKKKKKKGPCAVGG